MSEQNQGEVARQEPGKSLVKMDPSKKITDLDEASRLCDTLARSTIVPESLQRKASNIFIVIMAGQEMGLSWPVALRTIYSPGDGQIGIRGQLLLAKLREAGHSYTWEEAPDACTFRLKRNAYRPDLPDEDYSATFTVEDAIQAGLARRHENGTVTALSKYGKPMPWQQYSSDMLFWRAVAKCVRRAAPEVMLGFEVQGAEPVQEAEPEVQLKPENPTGAGQPGEPGGPEASTPAAELRDLDERMRGGQEIAEGRGNPDPTAAPGVTGSEPTAGPAPGAPGPASPDQTDGRLPGMPGDPGPVPDEPDYSLADQDPPASGAGTPASQQSPGRAAARAKSQVLAEQFTALGWTPKQYRAEVLRACSVYLRRRVKGVGEMTADEMMRLAEELSRLQRKHMDEPDTYPVALADKVEEWREAWEHQDTAGYDKFAETP